ncbi:MAG: cytochrome b/b6 domain-containing protein [Leptolyngbyaceae cyanobacterium bins.349]|nr:cytochrome b/b6 domain-containing protein [Leptolyngbyaceae cyanobacterium bins.349]
MRITPYQPLLLRLTHGITAILAIAALITGFLVYDSWDKRFGGLGLTVRDRGLIDIHGTFGFFLFFLFIAFAIYSVTAGRKKLVQGNSLSQLTMVGRPIWWVALQRLTNTTMLLAAAIAVGTGKLMDENWLPNGELNHAAYYAHLLAWVLVILGIAVHILMSVKVGGMMLLLSMGDFKVRSDDWLVKQMQRFRKK